MVRGCFNYTFATTGMPYNDPNIRMRIDSPSLDNNCLVSVSSDRMGNNNCSSNKWYILPVIAIKFSIPTYYSYILGW